MVPLLPWPPSVCSETVCTPHRPYCHSSMLPGYPLLPFHILLSHRWLRLSIPIPSTRLVMLHLLVQWYIVVLFLSAILRPLIIPSCFSFKNINRSSAAAFYSSVMYYTQTGEHLLRSCICDSSFVTALFPGGANFHSQHFINSCGIAQWISIARKPYQYW